MNSTRTDRVFTHIRILAWLIAALALAPGTARAQGAMTNGGTHRGVIQVGGVHTWTFEASLNDSVTIRVGEVTGVGPEPQFYPRIRLVGPGGLALGDTFGANAAELDLRAPV